MSEPNTAVQSEQQTDEKPAEGAEPEPTEELSEAAQARIAKLNAEAASYRKKLRDLEPLAKEAMSARDAQKSDYQRLQDEHERLLVELAESNRAAIREKVARQTGLPDELAELLRGDDEAEMTAHAKRLAVYVTPKAERRPDLSQGAQDQMALNGDPLYAALKSKLHIP